MSEAPLSATLDPADETASPVEAEPLAAQIDELVGAARAVSDGAGDQALENDIDRVIADTQQAIGSSEPTEDIVRRLDDHLSATAEGRMDAPEREPQTALRDPGVEVPSGPEAAATTEAACAAAEPVPTQSTGEEGPPFGEGEEGREGLEEQPPAPRLLVHAAVRRDRVVRVVAGVLTWPLAHLSPAGRDLIGWFSLVTLFNAACLWAYLLMPA